MGIVAPRIADRTGRVDDSIAVVMRIVRGLAWLGLVLALAAAAGFYAGVLEEDRLLDALVRGPLAGVERSDTAGSAFRRASSTSCPRLPPARTSTRSRSGARRAAGR